jgi:hypothetical protein
MNDLNPIKDQRRQRTAEPIFSPERAARQGHRRLMTEYKSFTPTEFKSDSHGSAQFIIATTGVLDSDGDVLLPGAIGQQIAVVIPAHDWQSQPLVPRNP